MDDLIKQNKVKVAVEGAGRTATTYIATTITTVVPHPNEAQNNKISQPIEPENSPEESSNFGPENDQNSAEFYCENYNSVIEEEGA